MPIPLHIVYGCFPTGKAVLSSYDRTPFLCGGPLSLKQLLSNPLQKKFAGTCPRLVVALSAMIEMSYISAGLSNTVATSHVYLLSPWNVASVTEEVTL